MNLRRLAAASTAAVGLSLLAAVSPAYASSCGSTSNSVFSMAVCSGTNGGTVLTYHGANNVTGHFEVWDHDNVSLWQNGKEQVWHVDDYTFPKLAYWTYTCAEFWAYQGNGTWARYGSISCVHL